MQVGKYRVPLRMNFDPLSATALPPAPERALSRSLLTSMNRLAFQQSQQQFSAAARQGIAQGARSELFQALGDRLSRLPASLPSLGQAVTQLRPGAVEDAGRPSVLSSGFALDLGTATSVGGSSGSSGAGSASFDPAGKLADQPLATAITAGTLDFQITLNGSTQNVSLAVDPTQDSLNDVLDRINAQPGVSAAYDAATGSVRLDAANQGAQFAITQTGSSSNFLQVVLEDQQQRVTNATAGSTIQAVDGELSYNDLTIDYQGQQFQITGLALSSRERSATIQAKAESLALQINSQLSGQTTLTATAVGGKLTFTDTASGTQPSLAVGISFTETVNTVTSGKGKTATTSSTLSLGLDNPNTTSSVSITGKPLIDASGGSSGGGSATPAKLGPDATLEDLAGQLGLAADDGRYTFSINGTELSFGEDATLNDVIDGINRSGAGVNAAYDSAGQRVVLTAEQPGATAIVAQDEAGNLTRALGLQVDQALFSAGKAPTEATEGVTTTTLSGEGVAALQRLGEQLGEALSLIAAATGERGAFKGDALLEDLGAALEGLFSPTGGQGIQSLGDLGLSLEDGEVRFDAARLEGLRPEQLDQANRFLGAFVGEKLQPLVKNGLQALADEQDQAPAAQRIAQQAVTVQAEISRMQHRQQMLLFHQVTIEKQQDQVKRQSDELSQMRDKLGRAEEEDQQRPVPQAPEPQASTFSPVSVTPIEPGTAPMPPALGSFGLSS